jgi:hypothetical protein
LDRPILAAILALFSASLVIAATAIPPWQNPDEPQHLMMVRLIQMHGPDFVLGADVDPAGERAILRSMVQHRWWEHYGRLPPDPPPTSFAEGPARVVDAYFGPPDGGSRLYYRAVAAVFRHAGIDDLLQQLYTMRAMAAGWSLLTLVCAWAGTRTLLGAHPALVVTSLMALHPQFALVSTTASPDAFVNLAGAVVWWRAAVLITGVTRARDVLLLLAAAVAAFLTRRVGATLVASATAIAVVCLRVPLIDYWRRRRWHLLGGGIALAAAVGLVLSTAPADLQRAIEFSSRFEVRQSARTIFANIDRLPTFLSGLFSTFWLSAGWLRYPAPAWWLLITIVLVVGAAAGLTRVRTMTERRAVRLAGFMVLLQTAVIVAFYFGMLQTGAQGRYLFPVLPAVFCLLWVGYSSLPGLRTRPVPSLLLVGVMAFLNVTGWILVVFPPYF